MTSVLHLSEAPPDPDALGGVAIHVAAMARHMAARAKVHTAHPSPAGLRVQEWSPDARLIAVLGDTGADSPGAFSRALSAALVGTGASVMFVHSPMLGPKSIVTAARDAAVRIAVSLHDGALACENHELLEGGERFCGVPEDLARCDVCLARTRRRPPGSIGAWRAEMGMLVSASDVFVAPSSSALENVARAHPEVKGRARIVPWGIPVPRARAPGPTATTAPIRVAVVGVWATAKGARQLPALLSACASLPVEFHLFGATEGESLGTVRLRSPRVVTHGAYRRAALAERIVQSGCHIALLPSVAAETFSLVLSEVTAVGLPVIASRIGALGERVTGENLGWTFDPWDPASLVEVLGRLLDDPSELSVATRRVLARPVRTETEAAEALLRIAEELGSAAPARTPSVPARAALLSEFAAGTERAARLSPSLVSRAVARLRKTDTYRDLRLRKLLSEEHRLAIEHTLSRFFSRVKSP